MKIGIKVYSKEKEYVEQIKDYVDFLEVLAMDLKHLNYFKNLNIPCTVHCNAFHQGVNFANKEKHYENYASFLIAQKFADTLNSPVIIVHPGEIESSQCHLANTVSFFKKYPDSRIIFENLPARYSQSDKLPLGAGVEEIKKLIELTNTGFCLDFSHAAITASELNCSPYDYIQQFMKLNPSYFHIGNIKKQGNSWDDNAHFKEGILDIKKLLSFLPKNAKIVIETKLNSSKHQEELKFIKENS